MRRALAIAVSLILLAWGAAVFHVQVTRVAPDAGIDWVDSARGVFADDVTTRKPGWKQGIRPGDRLLAVNGEPVERAHTAEEALRKTLVGEAISYRVERDGEELEFRVRPAWLGGGSPVYYYLSIVGLTFLGVGLIVWLRAARARAAVPFALLCQSMFLLLVLPSRGPEDLLGWSSYWGDLAGSLLAPALFLHINWTLAEEERGGARRRWGRALIYLPPFLLFLNNLFLIAFKGVWLFDDPVAVIRFKERLEQLYIAVFVIAGIIKAVRSYLSAERLQTRWQLKWMAWGSVFGFLPTALFYLAPLALNIRIGTWSELSVLPMAIVPLAFAAAIVRYRLLDLDIFLKRGTMAIGLLLCAAATYAGCYVVMDRAAGGSKPRGMNLSLILTTFLMVIFYPRVHRRLKGAVDHFFYRERYDYRRTLTEFGEALNRELSLPTLILKFTGRVERTFGVERVHVFVLRREHGELRCDALGRGLRLDDPVVKRLEKVDYLPLRDHPEVEKTASGTFLIDTLGMEYLLPLMVEGEIIAVLGVGTPHGGEPLTSEDLQLLVSLCRHAAVAFEGAHLYSALAEKVQEVEALRDFNESILQSSRVGILVADPDGRVMRVNRAFETLFGAPYQELLGLALAEVMPAGVFAMSSGGNGSRRDALPSEGVRFYRSSLRTRDGRRLLVNLTHSALVGADGGPRGRVITVDDVTEQVLREEEMQRRERLASIGMLASGIAHEVNTPLTGISSYTQMLLEKRRPDDPEYSILKKIEQQTFRASGIASSLLNFSRQADTDYQPLNVAEMIGETLQLFEPHLKGRRIELERSIKGPLPRVHGNRGRLQQVLMNLLLNAVDAMPQGGTMKVEASAMADRVRIEVSDTGVGIPPEHLEKIYDPFFTTKPRGQGTGLGLSVSYGIVGEHSGTLKAESTPGEGSRFVVSLPAADTMERRMPA